MKSKNMQSIHDSNNIESALVTKNEKVLCNICKLNTKTTINLYNHFIKDHSKLELSLCILNLLKLLAPKDAETAVSLNSKEKQCNRNYFDDELSSRNHLKSPETYCNESLRAENNSPEILQKNESFKVSEQDFMCLEKNDKSVPVSLKENLDASKKTEDSSKSLDEIIEYVVQFYGHDGHHCIKNSSSKLVALNSEELPSINVNEDEITPANRNNCELENRNSPSIFKYENQLPLENVIHTIENNFAGQCRLNESESENFRERESGQSKDKFSQPLSQHHKVHSGVNSCSDEIEYERRREKNVYTNSSDLPTSETIIKEVEGGKSIFESDPSLSIHVSGINECKKSTFSSSVDQSNSDLHKKDLLQKTAEKIAELIMDMNKESNGSSANKELKEVQLRTKNNQDTPKHDDLGTSENNAEVGKDNVKNRKSIEKIILTRKYEKKKVTPSFSTLKKSRMSFTSSLKQTSGSQNLGEDCAKTSLDHEELNFQYVIKKSATNTNESKNLSTNCTEAKEIRRSNKSTSKKKKSKYEKNISEVKINNDQTNEELQISFDESNSHVSSIDSSDSKKSEIISRTLESVCKDNVKCYSSKKCGSSGENAYYAQITCEDKMELTDEKHPSAMKVKLEAENNAFNMNKFVGNDNLKNSSIEKFEGETNFNQSIFCSSLGLVRNHVKDHKLDSNLDPSETSVLNNLSINKRSLYKTDQKLNFRLPMKFFAGDEVPKDVSLELPPFEITPENNSHQSEKYSLRSKGKETKLPLKRRKKANAYKKKYNTSCQNDCKTNPAPHHPAIVKSAEDSPPNISPFSSQNSAKLSVEDNSIKVAISNQIIETSEHFKLSDEKAVNNSVIKSTISTENIVTHDASVKENYKTENNPAVLIITNQATNPCDVLKPNQGSNPKSFFTLSQNKKLVTEDASVFENSNQIKDHGFKNLNTPAALNEIFPSRVSQTQQHYRPKTKINSCSTNSCLQELKPETAISFTSCTQNEHKRYLIPKNKKSKQSVLNCSTDHINAETEPASIGELNSEFFSQCKESMQYKNSPNESSSAKNDLSFLHSAKKIDKSNKEIKDASFMHSNILSSMLSKPKPNYDFLKTCLLINNSTVAIPLATKFDLNHVVNSYQNDMSDYIIVKLSSVSNNFISASTCSSVNEIEIVRNDSHEKEIRSNCSAMHNTIMPMSNNNLLVLNSVDKTAEKHVFITLNNSMVENIATRINERALKYIMDYIATINDTANKLKSHNVSPVNNLNDKKFSNNVLITDKKAIKNKFSLFSDASEAPFFSKLLTINDLVQLMVANNLELENEKSEIWITNDIGSLNLTNAITSNVTPLNHPVKIVMNDFVTSNDNSDNRANTEESIKHYNSTTKDVFINAAENVINIVRTSKVKNVNTQFSSGSKKMKTKKKRSKENDGHTSDVKSPAKPFVVDKSESCPNVSQAELCDKFNVNSFIYSPVEKINGTDSNPNCSKKEQGIVPVRKSPSKTQVSDSISTDSCILEPNSIKLETKDNLNYSIRIDSLPNTSENYKIVMPLQLIAFKVPNKVTNPPPPTMNLGQIPICQKSVNPNRLNKVAIPRTYKYEPKNSNEIPLHRHNNQVGKSANENIGNINSLFLTSNNVTSSNVSSVNTNEAKHRNVDQTLFKEHAGVIAQSELTKFKENNVGTPISKERAVSEHTSSNLIVNPSSNVEPAEKKLKLCADRAGIKTSNVNPANAFTVVKSNCVNNSNVLKVTPLNQCNILNLNSVSASNILNNSLSSANLDTLPKNNASTNQTPKSDANKEEDHLHFMLDPDNPRFYCSFCNRGYSKKNHLIRHVRMHMNDRPFKCQVCGKGFTTNSILKQHQRLHSGERPYKCSVCSKTFSQKSSLLTHTMLHTGKPFKCFYCEDAFVSNHKLLRHLRRHDIDDSFLKCRVCDLQFATEGAFTDHLKDVHNYPPANKGISFWKNPTGKTVIKDQYFLKKRRRVRKRYCNTVVRSCIGKADIVESGNLKVEESCDNVGIANV